MQKVITITYGDKIFPLLRFQMGLNIQVQIQIVKDEPSNNCAAIIVVQRHAIAVLIKWYNRVTKKHV